MKAQIFVVPAGLKEGLPEIGSPAFNSGMMFGMVMNFTDMDLMMKQLEALIGLGHDAEVTMLKDDEPWPAIEERRNKYFTV